MVSLLFESEDEAELERCDQAFDVYQIMNEFFQMLLLCLRNTQTLIFPINDKCFSLEEDISFYKNL